MTRKARPPAAAVAEAKKMLKWRDKYGRKQVKGATRVGWTRAQQLAKGRALTEATVRRMAAFQRHRKNAEVDDRYKGTPWKDRGRVAWGTWGGTSGVNWAIRTVKKWNREDKQKAAKKRQNKRAQRRRKRQR
jgi:hypothetical protein